MSEDALSPEVIPNTQQTVTELPPLEAAAQSLHEMSAPEQTEQPPAAPGPAAVADPSAEIEAKLAEQRRALELKEAQLATQEKLVNDGLELQRLAQSDPYEAYKRLKIPFKDLASQVANDGKPDPLAQTQGTVQQMQAELQQIREELATERALAETRKAIDAKGNDYRLIRDLGYDQQVAQIARQNGGDYEAALQHARQSVQSDLDRLAKAGWTISPPTEPKGQAQPAPKPNPTINNSLSSTPTREPKRQAPEDDFQALVKGISGALE